MSAVSDLKMIQNWDDSEIVSIDEALEVEDEIRSENSQKSKEEADSDISLAQKARIEKNRQRAKMLKEKKIISHPYAKVESSPVEKSIIKVQSTKFIDTGGGFLLEETDVLEQGAQGILKPTPGPIIKPDQPSCLECQEQFVDSYLFQTFDHPVCDSCRDPEDKHSLITKTDAKNEYLLKDCDLEKREPPLKFIVRKNPHNARWGDMKLYLHLQVEKRALEVWQSEEELRKEYERREEKRDKAKIKKYNKQVKALRMNVRSSMYDRTTKAAHVHEFGPDTYHEEEDNYTHTCKTCGYEETFEKM
ncbi:DNA repair protein complementing XP-A cells homolog [Anabrus simplex]|uniref:DNA repair protein complementing XP-A cells homolog n=1 Tax=Anabrus simplex TaxID=316456 RepID=UPI0034DD02B2